MKQFLGAVLLMGSVTLAAERQDEQQDSHNGAKKSRSSAARDFLNAAAKKAGRNPLGKAVASVSATLYPGENPTANVILSQCASTEQERAKYLARAAVAAPFDPSTGSKSKAISAEYQNQKTLEKIEQIEAQIKQLQDAIDQDSKRLESLEQHQVQETILYEVQLEGTIERNKRQLVYLTARLKNLEEQSRFWIACKDNAQPDIDEKLKTVTFKLYDSDDDK